MQNPSNTLVQRRGLLVCLLAFSLALAACGTSQEAQVAGVAITAATTTTTPAPVTIDAFVGLEWEPSVTYQAESFVVPLSFTVDREGWISRGADRRWTEVWFDEDMDGSADVTLTFLAHRPGLDPDSLVTEIMRTDGVRQLTPAVERTIGTTTMVVVDVEGDVDPQGTGLAECSQPASAQFTSIAGHELFEDGASFGIPACYRSRIWIFDVNGSTITAIGVVAEEDAFDELVVILEVLLERGTTAG